MFADQVPGRETAAQVREQALEAFLALDGAGLARVDFLHRQIGVRRDEGARRRVGRGSDRHGDVIAAVDEAPGRAPDRPFRRRAGAGSSPGDFFLHWQKKTAKHRKTTHFLFICRHYIPAPA